MEYEIKKPEDLIETYGLDAPVAFGNNLTMSLGQALQAEAAFCPADDKNRQDPDKRLTYLAGKLAAAGTLLPEHAYLLASETE